FARALGQSRAAALALYEKLRVDARFLTPFPPDLDILVWAPRARRASDASQLARRIFAEAARHQLHLALAELPVAFFDLAAAGMGRDRDTVTCLRPVLMKPEHRAWRDRICELLEGPAPHRPPLPPPTVRPRSPPPPPPPRGRGRRSRHVPLPRHTRPRSAGPRPRPTPR